MYDFIFKIIKKMYLNELKRILSINNLVLFWFIKIYFLHLQNDSQILSKLLTKLITILCLD